MAKWHAILELLTFRENIELCMPHPVRRIHGTQKCVCTLGSYVLMLKLILCILILN